MNSQEHERAAEQWLDEAIGRFQQAGPPVGFETRIIANLRARAVRRRRQGIFLLTGATAAVLVAALVASLPRTGQQAPANAMQQSTSSQNDVVPASPLAAANQPQQAPHRAVRGPIALQDIRPTQSANNVTAGTPKEEVFPTPAALNEQGKLLQAYFRQTPQQELALIAARRGAAADADIQDLSIAPIQIKELNPVEDKEQH